MVIQIETLDPTYPGGSGTPATYLGQNAKTANFLTSSLTPGSFQWKALANPYKNTTANPQTLAAVFKYAGTGQNFTPTNMLAIASGHTTARDVANPFMSSKLSTVNTGPNWAAQPIDLSTPVGLKNSAGTLVANTNNFQGSQSDSWDATATNDLKRGNVWTVGYGCRMSGVQFAMLGPVANNYIVSVYVNGTLNQSLTYDVDSATKFNANTGSLPYLHYLPLSPITLKKGDVVRMVLEPATDFSSDPIIFFVGAVFASSADRLAFTRGEDIRFTYGSSAPVWGETTTKLAPITPIIDQVEIPAGGRYVGNLSGGMNN